MWKKFHQFLSSIKKMHTKENGFLFFCLTVYIRCALQRCAAKTFLVFFSTSAAQQRAARRVWTGDYERIDWSKLLTFVGGRHGDAGAGEQSKDRPQPSWRHHLAVHSSHTYTVRAIWRRVTMSLLTYTYTDCCGRAWASANRGKWGQMTAPLEKWMKNYKAKTCKTVFWIFWEQSGQADVENGAMLTTYLFR